MSNEKWVFEKSMQFKRDFKCYLQRKSLVFVNENQQWEMSVWKINAIQMRNQTQCPWECAIRNEYLKNQCNSNEKSIVMSMSNYIWKPIETECISFDDGVAYMKPGPWNIMEGTNDEIWLWFR